MPAANERALEKAKQIPADALILDLEDAVAPDAKEAARANAVAAARSGEYGRREVTIRCNGLDTPWGADDLAAAATSGAAAVVVPKVSSSAVLDEVAGQEVFLRASDFPGGAFGEVDQLSGALGEAAAVGGRVDQASVELEGVVFEDAGLAVDGEFGQEAAPGQVDGGGVASDQAEVASVACVPDGVGAVEVGLCDEVGHGVGASGVECGIDGPVEQDEGGSEFLGRGDSPGVPVAGPGRVGGGPPEPLLEQSGDAGQEVRIVDAGRVGQAKAVADEVRGTLPRRYRDAGLLDVCDDCRASVRYFTSPLRVRYHTVKQRTEWLDDTHQAHYLETPIGTLREVRAYDGLRLSGARSEYRIKTLDDLRILEYVLQDEEWYWDAEAFSRDLARVGERGAPQF